SLVSIELTFAMRGTYVGTGMLKIYDSPNRSVLIGTATNTINDTSTGEFSSVTGTFNFSGVTLTAETSYYFEMTNSANSNVFYLWETSGNPYSGGCAYSAYNDTPPPTQYSTYDIKFVITYYY
ncbi:unnamed protein product, partial [marine sediment metagenome]